MPSTMMKSFYRTRITRNTVAAIFVVVFLLPCKWLIIAGLDGVNSSLLFLADELFQR